MIRVATANAYLGAQQGITNDQSAVMTTIAELSSGKQVNAPSDNPVGAAQASLLESNLSQLGQFKSNQAQASNLLNSASSTMTQAINVMQSVRTLLVQAGNGTLNDSDRSALAAQLQQSFDQLVGLANTSDGQGGYLFGGSVNSAPPFVQSGNNVTYQGDNLTQGLQISQTRTEQVRYPGSTVFLQVPNGAGGTQSVFSALGNAIAALQTPNASATVTAQNAATVSSALGASDQVITSLSNTQATMGAQLAELNNYASITGDQTLQSQTQLSGIVDLDYAKAASTLSRQQTQFQAALQSYSAISKLSLFNYM